MHLLKEGQKIRAWVDPPPIIRAMPERKRFFQLRSSLRSVLLLAFFPEWSTAILVIAGSPDAKLSFADGFDLLMVALMGKLTAGCAE